MRRPLLSSSVWALLPVLLTACSEHAEVSLTPAQQKKVEASLLGATPKPQHEIDAIIEDQVRLIGYDIDKTEVAPGDSFTVTYYIEGLSENPGDNMVFVHLQGRDNDRSAWMNLDHHPVEGLFPLRQLKKGQIVKDVQRITVKPDFSPGEAKVYWGLWRGDYRLKLKNPEKAPHDDKGRVVVATVTIKGTPRAPAGLPQAVAAPLDPGETITIDGKLDEPVWQRAQVAGDWRAPDGSDRPAPKTRARFAWDPTTLYVAVEAEDDDVWTTFTDRDSNTWEQEVIEMFIDADGDKKDYLELQVTPANVLFDARFPTHRSDLTAARAWNFEGWRTAARVDGTLNERDDTDHGYTIEMALPIAGVPGARSPAQAGDVWRTNLFRWDLPKGGKQQAAAFSPPIVPDFHALDRFGRLRLGGAAPASNPASAPASQTTQSAPTTAPASNRATK